MKTAKMELDLAPASVRLGLVAPDAYLEYRALELCGVPLCDGTGGRAGIFDCGSREVLEHEVSGEVFHRNPVPEHAKEVAGTLHRRGVRFKRVVDEA